MKGRMLGDRRFLRVSMLLMCCSVFTSAAMAEPFRHKFGELREYHSHWLSVCPDKYDQTSASPYLTSCWTATFSGRPGFFMGNRLSIERNRASGVLSITFTPDVADQIDRQRPVEFRFSGYDSISVFPGSGYDNERVGDTVVANSFRIQRRDQIDLLVKKMRDRRHMILSIPTSDGLFADIPYSMMGVVSSITFMEEFAAPGPS